MLVLVLLCSFLMLLKWTNCSHFPSKDSEFLRFFIKVDIIFHWCTKGKVATKFKKTHCFSIRNNERAFWTLGAFITKENLTGTVNKISNFFRIILKIMLPWLYIRCQSQSPFPSQYGVDCKLQHPVVVASWISIWSKYQERNPNPWQSVVSEQRFAQAWGVPAMSQVALSK